MARRPRLDRDLDRSLVPGERAIVAVRHHWLSLSREIGAAVAATVLAFVVDVKVPTSEGGPMLLHNLSLLLWWGTMGWLVWTWLNWRREWFVATDKRFLLFYGFIRRKVAMMPLTKVTDMTFDQSLLGRIVGYGTFVMESAGQGQALSVVAYVPNAQVHYQAICSELFGTTVAEAEAQAEGGAGPGVGDGSGGPGGGGWDGPGGGHGPDGGPLAGGSGPAAVHAPAGWRSDPTADPIQRNPQESWYRSSNLGAPSRRLGDTGEIPVVGAAGSQGSAGGTAGTARASGIGAVWAPWALESDDGQPEASQGDHRAAGDDDADPRHGIRGRNARGSNGRDDDRGSHAREIPLYPPAEWSES